MAPVVAVPTTAGTGSEVGRASVITDLRDHTKKIIFHPKMMPGIVLEDPELTVGLPPHITAAVGMDALSHNLEAYCAPGYHPMAEGIAVEGMRLIKEYLPRAVANGADIEARAQMLDCIHDGRNGVPERPRRHAQSQPSVLGQPEHAPWADECGRHALRARMES